MVAGEHFSESFPLGIRLLDNLLYFLLGCWHATEGFALAVQEAIPLQMKCMKFFMFSPETSSAFDGTLVVPKSFADETANCGHLLMSLHFAGCALFTSFGFFGSVKSQSHSVHENLVLKLFLNSQSTSTVHLALESTPG